MPWTLRTLHSARPMGLGPTAQARYVENSPCPRCGKNTPPDMMVDLRMFPVEDRPDGHEFVCDGCREWMFSQGLITRVELYRAHGAPAEVVERVRKLAEHRNNPPKREKR